MVFKQNNWVEFGMGSSLESSLIHKYNVRDVFCYKFDHVKSLILLKTLQLYTIQKIYEHSVLLTLHVCLRLNSSVLSGHKGND